MHGGMRRYCKFIRNGDGRLLGAEVPAVLLLGFRVASGIEMDTIVLFALRLRHL